MDPEKRSVLFICLGNICRSPMAEAVFSNLINGRGLTHSWTVDSAAIGPWHVGKQPDTRTLNVLKGHGINFNHKVRQITKDDFSKFNYIFGMDDDNMLELNEMAPRSSSAKIELLGSYDPKGETIIRDPYYDRADAGFHKCYEQCVRSCTGFLDSFTKSN